MGLRKWKVKQPWQTTQSVGFLFLFFLDHYVDLPGFLCSSSEQLISWKFFIFGSSLLQLFSWLFLKKSHLLWTHSSYWRISLSKVLLVSVRWRGRPCNMQATSFSLWYPTCSDPVVLAKSGHKVTQKQYSFWHIAAASSMQHVPSPFVGWLLVKENSESLLVSTTNKKYLCIQLFKLFRNNLVSKLFRWGWLMHANRTVQVKFSYWAKMSAFIC